ncbi:hypothetical protein D3C76_1052010 [compost metagenome]
MQLVEILRGVAHVARPVETQPLDIALDGVDVFLVFLGRVGVIETQMTDTAEFLGQAEVHADRLGVTDVQVAVGLRRKTGDDAAVLARVQVSLHDRAQEVGGYDGGSFGIGGGGVGGGLAHRILGFWYTARAGRLNQSAYHSPSGWALACSLDRKFSCKKPINSPAAGDRLRPLRQRMPIWRSTLGCDSGKNTNCSLPAGNAR